MVTNETTAANLLLTGGLNIATVTGPDRARLQKAKLFKRSSSPSPESIWFNENKGHPTANAAVRKGIVQALQLGQLGKVFTSGDGVPDEAADAEDVHAVRGEFGHGERAEAQLGERAEGIVGPSRPVDPLRERRRPGLGCRNGAHAQPALFRG